MKHNKIERLQKQIRALKLANKEVMQENDNLLLRNAAIEAKLDIDHQLFLNLGERIAQASRLQSTCTATET